MSKRTREELGRLVTVREAAGIVGVTPMRVWQLIKDGRLEAFLGLVDPVDLEQFKCSMGRGRPRVGFPK